MHFYVEQGLMGVLPVDVNERVPDLLENGGRYGNAVDAAGVLSGSGQFAEQDQLSVLRFHLQLFQNLVHGFRRGDLEFRFHGRPVFPILDHIAVCALSEHEIERFDDNRFPGAGLARQNRETVLEFDRLLIDQRYVPDMDSSKHGCVSPFTASCSGTS